LLRPVVVVLPVLGWALLLPSELGPRLGQPWPKPPSSAKLAGAAGVIAADDAARISLRG